MPRWGQKGDELFYIISASKELMAARVRTARDFAILGQNRLFATIGFTTTAAHATYDVTADGQRFVMLRPGVAGGGKDEASHLILVQTFLADLKRVLP